MCPYYLDGDLFGPPIRKVSPERRQSLRTVIPVYIGYCVVFKDREEAGRADCALVSQNSTACGRLRGRALAL